MDSFIIAYIANRMAQLGFKLYQFEPYCMVQTNNVNEMVVAAPPNEYYYLTSRELAIGTQIIANNNYYTIEGYYQDQEYTKLQEFIGNIRIIFPKGADTQVVEFIRVVPGFYK